MGSSFWIQRFRVWFPPGDPPRERYVTQAVELCLQAGSYSFLPPQRGATAQVPPTQQVPSSHHRKKVLTEYPYNDPLFCSSQTVPLLVNLEKGKTPSIKQFLSPAPKEHHTRDTGEKNSAKQTHTLAKTHQEFPIKVPFYLPLKRFTFFFFSQNLNTTKQITSPHTH